MTTAPVEPAPTLPPEPETEPETEPPAETYRIKGSSVNVRSEPSTSGRILVQLGNGTEVVYVKRYDNDWAVINYDGQEAYVSSKYIEKVEPVASTGGDRGQRGPDSQLGSCICENCIGKIGNFGCKKRKNLKVLPLFGVLQW